MATKKSTSKKGASKKGASTKKPAAAAAGGASLSQLQTRINQDTRLRSQFLKDPGSVLRKQGVELSPEKAQQLAQFTQQVTAPAKQVSIDALQQRAIGGASKLRTEVEVTVSVRIRF